MLGLFATACGLPKILVEVPAKEKLVEGMEPKAGLLLPWPAPNKFCVFDVVPKPGPPKVE